MTADDVDSERCRQDRVGQRDHAADS
jgi:hypothetical protein